MGFSSRHNGGGGSAATTSTTRYSNDGIPLVMQLMQEPPSSSTSSPLSSHTRGLKKSYLQRGANVIEKQKSETRKTAIQQSLAVILGNTSTHNRKKQQQQQQQQSSRRRSASLPSEKTARRNSYEGEADRIQRSKSSNSKISSSSTAQRSSLFHTPTNRKSLVRTTTPTYPTDDDSSFFQQQQQQSNSSHSSLAAASALPQAPSLGLNNNSATRYNNKNYDDDEEYYDSDEMDSIIDEEEEEGDEDIYETPTYNHAARRLSASRPDLQQQQYQKQQQQAAVAVGRLSSMQTSLYEQHLQQQQQQERSPSVFLTPAPKTPPSLMSNVYISSRKVSPRMNQEQLTAMHKQINAPLYDHQQQQRQLPPSSYEDGADLGDGSQPRRNSRGKSSSGYRSSFVNGDTAAMIQQQQQQQHEPHPLKRHTSDSASISTPSPGLRKGLLRRHLSSSCSPGTYQAKSNGLTLDELSSKLGYLKAQKTKQSQSQCLDNSSRRSQRSIDIYQATAMSNKSNSNRTRNSDGDEDGYIGQVNVPLKNHSSSRNQRSIDSFINSNNSSSSHVPSKGGVAAGGLNALNNSSNSIPSSNPATKVADPKKPLRRTKSSTPAPGALTATQSLHGGSMKEETFRARPLRRSSSIEITSDDWCNMELDLSQFNEDASGANKKLDISVRSHRSASAAISSSDDDIEGPNNGKPKVLKRRVRRQRSMDLSSSHRNSSDDEIGGGSSRHGSRSIHDGIGDDDEIADGEFLTPKPQQKKRKQKKKSSSSIHSQRSIDDCIDDDLGEKTPPSVKVMRRASLTHPLDNNSLRLSSNNNSVRIRRRSIDYGCGDEIATEGGLYAANNKLSSSWSGNEIFQTPTLNKINAIEKRGRKGQNSQHNKPDKNIDNEDACDEINPPWLAQALETEKSKDPRADGSTAQKPTSDTIPEDGSLQGNIRFPNGSSRDDFRQSKPISSNRLKPFERLGDMHSSWRDLEFDIDIGLPPKYEMPSAVAKQRDEMSVADSKSKSQDSSVDTNSEISSRVLKPIGKSGEFLSRRDTEGSDRSLIVKPASISGAASKKSESSLGSIMDGFPKLSISDPGSLSVINPIQGQKAGESTSEMEKQISEHECHQDTTPKEFPPKNRSVGVNTEPDCREEIDIIVHESKLQKGNVATAKKEEESPIKKSPKMTRRKSAHAREEGNGSLCGMEIQVGNTPVSDVRRKILTKLFPGRTKTIETKVGKNWEMRL